MTSVEHFLLVLGLFSLEGDHFIDKCWTGFFHDILLSLNLLYFFLSDIEGTLEEYFFCSNKGDKSSDSLIVGFMVEL